MFHDVLGLYVVVRKNCEKLWNGQKCLMSAPSMTPIWVIFTFHCLGAMCVLSCSVVSDSPQPHGLSSARLLCPWNFPGKSTGVDCHFLLPGIFPNQGSNRALQADSLPSEPPGKSGFKHKPSLQTPVPCLLLLTSSKFRMFQDLKVKMGGFPGGSV